MPPLPSIFNATMTEIRLARKADAPAIHALLWEAKDEIPLIEKFKDEWYLKSVEDHCKRRAVWVAQTDDEIAGTMIMEGNEIFYLAVNKKHRRKGVGRALIVKAKKFCTSKKWDMLTGRARRKNTPILELLVAEGFRLDRRAECPDLDVYTWARRAPSPEF